VLHVNLKHEPCGGREVWVLSHGENFKLHFYCARRSNLVILTFITQKALPHAYKIIIIVDNSTSILIA